MKSLSLFLVLFIAVPGLSAQTEIKAPEKWTPEDVIFTEYMTNVSFSNDGTKIVWSKRRPLKSPEKDKFVSDLYLTYLNKEEKGSPLTVQLTRADENDHSALFSKDDRYLYYLSSRNKGKVLWRLDLLGGEPEKIREFEHGISNLQWKDEHTLLFLSNDGKTLTEIEEEEKKDNVKVIEDTLRWKPTRIYSYSLKDKKAKRITNNDRPVNTYSVSPDGKWMVYTQAMGISFAADATDDPIYFLMDLSDGSKQQILQQLEFPSSSMKFDMDSKGFYFTSAHSSDPQWNGAGISELYYYDLNTSTVTKVSLAWENGLGQGYTLMGNHVLASLANRATHRLTWYEKKGTRWNKKTFDLGDKNDHVQVLAASKKGDRIIYTHSTASSLPRYYMADLKGNRISVEKEVIKLNKKLSKKEITKSEVITWKGYQGVEVTGILYYPSDYREGQKYPLMLSIHGGPSSQDTDTWSERWSTYPNILAQRGAFVLKPNYQGSSNHGLEYVEAIKGNYYEPEMEDITRGIAYLDSLGMIDKNKLGTMGWSNGAILTTMLTVRYPDMFKVAAAGAGDVNWSSDYGTCRFGVSFDQSYFGGAPWDDLNGKSYNENYILKSPLFEMERVKTPTIIFHGSEDRAVPRDQGWEYYRALQQIDQAPVRFLWFPGQPHGLGKITHQLRKMKEELQWIDHYLFGKDASVNKVIKKDSPLALLMAKSSLKQQDGNWGMDHEGLLIPETRSVKKDSIAIGVFEVTNAQYAAFKKDHKFSTAKANHPVIVSRADAGAYLQWLSALTGKTYRLPNTAEAKTLNKAALKVASKENTLSHWAGYTPVPEEAAQLNQKARSLDMDLYTAVGQFKSAAIGSALVYDLGGNAAEFAENGGRIGYSAYELPDPLADSDNNLDTAGFRVILEE